MKKFAFCVLFAFVAALAAGCALADEPAAEGGMRIIKADAAGNPVDFVTKDGLHIVYMGTFRCMEAPKPAEGQEPAGEEQTTNDIMSVFMVMAGKDTTLWTDVNDDGVDTRTNGFGYRRDNWCHIAWNNTRQANILEEIWVRVEFFHVLSLEKFGELPRIGRIQFFFNGTKPGDKDTTTALTYRKLKVQPWSAWKEIEPKVIAMEEGEEEYEEPEALEGPGKPAAPKDAIPDGIEAVG